MMHKPGLSATTFFVDQIFLTEIEQFKFFAASIVFLIPLKYDACQGDAVASLKWAESYLGLDLDPQLFVGAV